MNKEYKYRGAEVSIIIQFRYLSEFCSEWFATDWKQVKLPETDDPDYRSPESLLIHPLRSSGGYLKWICSNLDLPDPEIDEVPGEVNSAGEIFDYLDHLRKKWMEPLRNIPLEKFLDKTYKSNWEAFYCVDAMLEHAAMHPQRHLFQLRRLKS